MANYIKFLRGTPAAFEKITTKDDNTLYFISESGATTGSLYLGSKLISSCDECSSMKIGDLKDVIIDSANLKDGDVLTFDWASQTWVNKSVEEVAVDIMKGATSSTNGSSGLVPQPKAGEQEYFLRADGTWASAGVSSSTLLDISNLKTQVSSLIGDSAKADGTIPSVKEIALSVLTDALIPENAKESLDTLQEISAWIQNHPDDVSAINSSISNLQTTVGNIYDVLYGSTDADGNKVEGLIETVNNMKNEEGGVYVLQSTYNSEVGDLTQILNRSSETSTLVDEINAINQRISWGELE